MAEIFFKICVFANGRFYRGNRHLFSIYLIGLKGVSQNVLSTYIGNMTIFLGPFIRLLCWLYQSSYLTLACQ